MVRPSILKNKSSKNKKNRYSNFIESNNSKIIFRKKFKRKRQNPSSVYKFIDNPSINHFNLNSQFIYDINEYKTFFKNNNNKKLILVNEKEKQKLNDIIKEILIEKESEYNTNFVKIPENTFINLKNYINIKEKKDPLISFVKDLFETTEERSSLSCRKITNLYFSRTGKKTNRTTINKIIKNILGYKFLRTAPKPSCINDSENILISLTFIKIIVRCIILGFNILFCDETGITNKNNNYNIWRKKEENVYQNCNFFKRKNLIMTISNEEVIYYEISDESTDSTVFLNYMKNLKNIIEQKDINNYVIVMDNLSSHKTKELLEFYSKNKINIIFNAPRMSNFNSIELIFRSIKNILYKQLFSSINDTQKKLEEIIKNIHAKKTLLFNYKETLSQYLTYIQNHENFDFNLI